MSKHTIRRMENEIGKLEAATKSKHNPYDDLPAPNASHLLKLLEIIARRMMPDGADVFQTDDERRAFWPIFELLCLFSAKADHDWPSSEECIALDIAAAGREWLDSGDALNRSPFTPLTLHVVKSHCWFFVPGSRTQGMPSIEKYGVPDAEYLADTLARLSPHPPWHREFPHDPATWPAAIRRMIDAALVRSGSMPPSPVPPFDKSHVPQYRCRCGPWVENFKPELIHRTMFTFGPPRSAEVIQWRRKKYGGTDAVALELERRNHERS